MARLKNHTETNLAQGRQYDVMSALLGSVRILMKKKIFFYVSQCTHDLQ